MSSVSTPDKSVSPAAVVSTTRVAITSWSWLALALLAAELVFLFGPTVRWLLDRWTMSVWHHAHGLLIPPVVAYFVYRELQAVKGLPRSSSAWGFAVLLPALALMAIDAGMHTQLLSAAALVLALPGFALLLLGVPRTRAIAFPLSFAAFALPIPLAFTERLHWVLRRIATIAADHILPVLNVPVYAEGTTLLLPPGALQISDACSGFSTLYAAVAVAFLTAYSTPDVRRRIMVLLSAVPVAIAANIVRVVLLSVLVVWEGAWVLETVLHPLSGMMTFAISLPVIFWLGGDAGERREA